MFQTTHLVRLSAGALLWAASTVSFAEDFTACPIEQLSHVQASECLDKEYRGADALLKQKLAQLLSLVEPVEMTTAPAADVQAKRRQIQSAIRQADALWRKSLDIECDALLEASYGLGTGWDIPSYECRLARTRERIKFLSLSPSYSWLWQR